MTLASDLMGFGLPPSLARKLASAGNGPVTISAAGSGQTTATAIKCDQYLMSCTNASGSNGIILPAIGGDTGAYIGDDFIVNNASGSNLQVYAPTGVSISWGGSNTAGATGVTLSTHTTTTFYAISSTQWAGVKGT